MQASGHAGGAVEEAVGSLVNHTGGRDDDAFASRVAELDAFEGGAESAASNLSWKQVARRLSSRESGAVDANTAATAAKDATPTKRINFSTVRPGKAATYVNRVVEAVYVLAEKDGSSIDSIIKYVKDVYFSEKTEHDQLISARIATALKKASYDTVGRVSCSTPSLPKSSPHTPPSCSLV